MVCALQEEAIAFCKKYGWEYTVEQPKQKRIMRQKRFNGYGDNFRCELAAHLTLVNMLYRSALLA